MQLIPALDLLAGASVRLLRGSYQDVTRYGDPLDSVAQYVEEGAKWIHLVDLDAARHIGADNRDLIATLVKSANAHFEVGGGIRSLEDADALIGLGVTRIVIGTRAVSDIGFFGDLASRFAGKVAAGLDYRRVGGKRICAIDGWVKDSDVELGDALARVIDAGAIAVVLTDISKDGTLSGPDLKTYGELAPICAKAGVELVASGGVSSLGDLEDLAKIAKTSGGLAAVISGKAIQEKRFSVQEGVALCRRYG